MNLACLNTHFGNAGMSFTDFLATCQEAGVEAVELGVANRMSAHGLDAAELLGSASHRRDLVERVSGGGLRIGALNCFGNPLHPDQGAAVADRLGIEATIRLAAELGCPVVATASGCPGDVRWPIWITWPVYWDGLESSQWEKAVDAWSRLGRLADEMGVVLALKLHPGQIVYNTSTFLRLADACGPAVMAGIDPAHLFYQGMDPMAVVRRLEGRIGHIHAKDAILNADRIALDGVIDASPLNLADRSWRCAAVGEGHPVEWWRDFVDTLAGSGYTGLISIEHEDSQLEAHQALTLNASRLRDAGLR